MAVPVRSTIICKRRQPGLPLYVFCDSHLLAARLRRSNIDASAGAVEEVARIIGQIQTRWPRVKILLRADSGFAGETFMTWCEGNRVGYVFGLARNERLVGGIADELAAAEAESLARGGPARRLADFTWRTLDSWRRERRVVAKAEHLPKGSNPRFIVTSLPASEIDAALGRKTARPTVLGRARGGAGLRGETGARGCC